MIKFYIVDVETTGLNASLHEVNEVSIIRCEDKVQLTQFIKCEHPERANFDALKITNKTMADLQKGNSKEYVVDKIITFLSEDDLTSAHRCFVAHNASFDRKFLHALFEKVDKELPVNLWLCSMALTKTFYKKAGIKAKANLHAACDNVGVKRFNDCHTSKVDTRNTYLLHRDLVEVKGIDYLPLIKTLPHVIDTLDSELDPDLLDE